MMLERKVKFVPLKYEKLLKLLEEKGYTSYRIRKEKVMGQATLTDRKSVV